MMSFKKIILFIIITFSLMIILACYASVSVLSVAAVSAGETEQPYLGDVSGDSNIAVGDAILVLREIVGLTDLESEDEEAWQRADVNLDGTIAVGDAIMILRRIVGLITDFTPVDSPVVFTKTALNYVLQQTDRHIVNLARDITLTGDPLVIKRNIAINGELNHLKHAIDGEVVVSEEVDNFSAQNIYIHTLTLYGGGQESVLLNNANIEELNVNSHVSLKLEGDTWVTRANFYSKAKVQGGSRIYKAWIAFNVDINDVDFGEEKPQKPIFKSVAQIITFVALNIENADGKLESEDISVATVTAKADSITIISIDEGKINIIAESDSGKAATVNVVVDEDGSMEIEITPYTVEQTATPEITTEAQTVNTDTISIEGTAEADAAITITGGSAEAVGKADANSNFSVEVNLTPDTVNTLSVTAQTADKTVSEPATVEINQITDYTLKIKAGEGGTTNPKGELTQNYGDKVKIIAMPDTGYVFINWTVGDKEKSTEAELNYIMPAENVTLAANFAIKTYTVTFTNYDGTELKVETVDHGSNATPPDTPIREGFYFTGWDKELNNVTSDLTVTATYESKQTVTPVITNEVRIIRTIANLIDGVAEIEITIPIEGIAEANALITITGGSAEAYGEAGADGIFCVEVTIKADAVNTLIVIAQAPGKTVSEAATVEITHETVFPDRTEIKIIEQPSETLSTLAILPAPAIQLVDESDNPMAFEGLAITVSLQKGETEGEFSSGTLTVFTDSEGKAVFKDLIITEANTYKLYFNVFTSSIDDTESDEFEVVPSYYLFMTVKPSVAGTVTGENLYKAGEEVSLIAEASHGYQFDNWTATAGIFEDATQQEATFTMPEEDVEITAVFSYTGTAQFDVYPHENRIWGHSWAQNAPITITVNGEVFNAQTGEREWEPSHVFHYYNDPDIRINAGDRITVSDGTTTKEHIVSSLKVTEVNTETNTVTGEVEPHSEVEFMVSGVLGIKRFQSDENGSWEAVFPIPGINPGDNGSVTRRDDERDITRVNWRAHDPSFIVNLTANSVWGNDWPSSSEITVTVTKEGSDGDPLFKETIHSNEWRGFDLFFREWDEDFSIEPGHEITVVTADGFYKKTHTVTDLKITEINSQENTLSGTSNRDGKVRVTVYADLTEEATVANGEWLVGFPEGGIEPGISGFAEQNDDDGNTTRLNWRALNPHFTVDLTNNIIRGNDWPPNEEITVTVNSSSGDEKEFSAHSLNWGYLELDFKGEEFKIKPGHTVTISAADGIHEKTHTVIDLEVTDINDEENTVSGTSNVDGAVLVTLFSDPENYTKEALAEDGNWAVEFFEGNIKPSTKGSAEQSDADGDTTLVNWRLHDPYFTVNLTHYYLSGNDWPAGKNVNIIIKDDEDILFEGSTSVDFLSGFYFPFAELPFTIKPGYQITVTDSTGKYSKEHTVRDFQVTDVNPKDGTLSGQSDREGMVQILAFADDGYILLDTITDENGTWTTQLPENTVKPGTSGFARQKDDEGDMTEVSWRAHANYIVANLTRNSLSGHDWPAGEDVTIKVYDTDDNKVFSVESMVADEWGNFFFSFGYTESDFTIKAGHRITVNDSSEIYSKTHIVRDLEFTEVDDDADSVSGRAKAGSNVRVILIANNYIYLEANTEDDGTWKAEFTEGSIIPGRSGFAEQSDSEGDTTRVEWRLHTPKIAANLSDSIVKGEDWPPRDTVTIEVDDGSEIITFHHRTDNRGFFNFSFHDNNFTVKAGHAVAVTDSSGLYSTNHEIINLELAIINQVDNYLSGKTDYPGGKIEVIAFDGPRSITVEAMVEPDGTWTAVFDEEVFDIVPETGGHIVHYDSDGNSTRLNWVLPHPFFRVELQHDFYIEGSNWLPGAEVIITVEDDEGIVFNETTTVRSEGPTRGYFVLYYFNEYGFTMEPGYQVTITDGINTRTHTVRNLFITSVDYDTNTISGTANPGSLVIIFANHQTNEIFNLETVADDAGNWELITTDTGNIEPGYHIEAKIYDDEGNGTSALWDLTFPTFIVTPANSKDMPNMIIGADYEPDQDVSIYINEVGYVAENVIKTDSNGEFKLLISEEDYEIETGDKVRVVAGDTDTTHTVTALQITDVDRDKYIAEGTAEADSVIMVLIVEITENVELSHIFGILSETDDNNEWQANFGTVGQPINEGQYILAIDLDDTGNMTAFLYKW